jgi:hypothetical protein
MAQRTNPAAVRFESDGDVYTLLCDMNALADFEAEFSVNAFDILGGKLAEVPLKYLRGLFWASLQEHHPGLDLRQAGRLMQSAPEKLLEAFHASFPEPEKATAVGKPKASRQRVR